MKTIVLDQNGKALLVADNEQAAIAKLFSRYALEKAFTCTFRQVKHEFIRCKDCNVSTAYIDEAYIGGWYLDIKSCGCVERRKERERST